MPSLPCYLLALSLPLQFTHVSSLRYLQILEIETTIAHPTLIVHKSTPQPCIPSNSILPVQLRYLPAMPGHFPHGCDFIDDPSAYECCICFGVVRDAIAHECGTLYCSGHCMSVRWRCIHYVQVLSNHPLILADCWSVWSKGGSKVCPTCTKPSPEHAPEYRARRAVLNLQLTCSNCDQTIR
jgi:hypothetical protein